MTIKGMLDELLPPAFRQETSMLQHLLDEMKTYHCLYGTLFQLKGDSKVTNIMSCCLLLGLVTGVMGSSILLNYFLFSTSRCDTFLTHDGCDAAYESNVFYSCTWRDDHCALSSAADLLSDTHQLFFTLSLLSFVCILCALPVQLIVYLLATLVEDYIQARQLQQIHPAGWGEERKDALEQYEDFGQELAMVQSRRGTLLRAAACFHLKRHLDYVPLSHELQGVLSPQKTFPWPQVPAAFAPSAPLFVNLLRYWWGSLKHWVYAPADPSLSMALLVHAW
ncbi:hypothetical protein EON64_15290, partial [archaeon]